MAINPPKQVLVIYPDDSPEEPQSLWPSSYNEYTNDEDEVFVYELKGRAKITNNVKVEVKPLTKGK